VSDAPDPVRLVVLADSFAFVDHRGPQLPSEPALYPNVATAALATRLGRPVRTSVVARPGWGVREVWRMLTKDRHVQFELLAGADGVILAIGSFDHLPTGVPAVLEAVVPFLRPAPVRRRARRVLAGLHPRAIALTAGRFPKTPAGEFARLYDAILLQLRGLTRGAAGVVLGPAGQRAAHYAARNPHLAAREELHTRIAGRHGFAVVPATALVAPYLDQLNPDGIHWPPGAHAAVGAGLAAPLADQLVGRAPRPPAPRW
jgi:hypothetical protein